MYYYLLALISGAAITTQVGINVKLLSNLGSPVLASLISFSVGTIGLAIVYILAACYGLQPVPTLDAISQTSSWMWTGGLLGAFYIFTTIFCSPKIGFANMFSLVVAGQIVLSIIFDHFGLLGSPVHLVTPFRLIGVALLIVGVYLIQTN
ncbi:DMT family transporter [Pelosinus propionicus]|uniref:Transporter family-2 protein n=1 Tax=Pelosinus propionicus DSM 13327 TaxID=1123291 RepID=A0A1I4QJ93_9FIRM|nr:DMT family transporter [Pelosinus propionicus]SFM39826.1 transporter family-2 protein [Pelosinus propionicus DSM 13327]